MSGQVFPCRKCGGPLKLCVTMKPGENQGRQFYTCEEGSRDMNHNCNKGTFAWARLHPVTKQVMGPEYNTSNKSIHKKTASPFLDNKGFTSAKDYMNANRSTSNTTAKFTPGEEQLKWLIDMMQEQRNADIMELSDRIIVLENQMEDMKQALRDSVDSTIKLINNVNSKKRKKPEPEDDEGDTEEYT